MNTAISVFGGIRFTSFESNDELYIGGKEVLLGLDCKVVSLAIFHNTVIVIIDDPDLHVSVRDGYRKNRKANIMAFDYNGNLIPEITDVASESLHLPYNSSYIPSQESKNSFSISFGVTFDDTHEYLILLDSGDGRYIIDITERKLVAQLAYRG